MPGMAGTTARPPTLMKICGAASRSGPTLISCADSKRAWPSYTVRFFVPLSQPSTPVRDFPETASLRAFTRFMSTVTGPPAFTPYSAARRARCAA